MKKEKKLVIKDLEVKDIIKDNLKDFNKFIKKYKKNNLSNNINFTIILDNMSIHDKDIYFDYIPRILKDEGITKKTSFGNDRVNSSVLIDFDSLYYYRRLNDKDKLLNYFTEASKNNNILIFYSSKDIEEYDIIKESHILDTSPVYRISHSYNNELEYNSLISKYESNGIKYDISKENFNELYESVIDNDFAKSISISDYLYNYSIFNKLKSNDKCITIDTFNSFINKDEEEIIDEIINECNEKIDLNSLTGLSSIKEELNTLFNYVEFKKKINSKDTTYLNLFFLGNPGTGKTMVASIISSKLYEMGYLESDEIIKVIPTDLIGEFVGQTKNKIRNILNKAKGKLLFIDEAYLMYNPNYKAGNNPFMEEAIVELMKYLEDPKNIVIFAGYTNKMRKLYDANPGLKSRIYKEIEFNDYTKDELYKILSNDLNKQGLTIDKNNKKDIMNYINYLKKDKNFGNARSMLKLSQELIMTHANLNNNSLVITKEDLPKYKDDIKEMGF